MKHTLVLLSCLIALGIGCDVAAPDDDFTTTTSALAPDGHPCPNGWHEGVSTRLCPPGTILVHQSFGGQMCNRCAPLDEPGPSCNGVWLPAEAMIKCAAGSVIVSSHDGACKRCARNGGDASGHCSSDADCFRTGCSGQICGSEPTVTTCEWRPEYACYADEYCVCGRAGSCAWADDPELNACLDDASGFVPITR